MTLQLTIIKFPPGIVLAEDRKTFGPQGGLIGRGVDNDWVLSDPERFLSSKHCQITKEGERYFLTDLSTNGTFVNGSGEPLGRGSRVVLNGGDSFDVGDYRFQVVLESEDDPFAASPFATSSSSFGNSSFGEPNSGSRDDFAYGSGNSVEPESMFMSSDYEGAIKDIAPDSLKVIDPLVALDKANQAFKSSSGADPFVNSFTSDPFASGRPSEDPFAKMGSREDSADLMSESVAWPSAKSESPLLPEDWADDISLIGGRKTKSSSHLLPDDDSLIKSTPPPKPEPPPSLPAQSRDSLLRSQPAKTTGAVQSSSSVSAVPNPAGRAERQAPPRQATAPSNAGAVDRTLLEALGLDDANLTDDQIREIHRTVGLMMRETLDGLMQVLRSRTSIKNEFRINITTIQPVENNPIKFSVSVDEVLDIMFLRRTRAYKAPLDAVQESFQSIADHQLAVIAGIRSAFRSALSRFDPERLEEEFKQSGKAGLLPGVIKGKLWSSYQEHYQKMVNDMERSFQDLFGDEFVQAYEDQMRKLANARKRDL